MSTIRMTKKTALVALGIGAGIASLAAASACREPTQLTLELTTDVRCADRITSAIVVGTLAQTAQSLTERPPSVQTNECTERGAGNAYIGSLVVVPSGDDTGEVAIKVVAGIGIPPEQCTDPADKRCITARRVRKYVPNTKLVLPITLNDACRGVPCGVDETCSRGQCVSVRCEDTNTCEPAPRDASVGDGEVVDGGDAGDATVADARPSDGGTELPFKLSLGRDFACALRESNKLAYCWGKNDVGQAGQPGDAGVPTPTLVPGTPAFAELHAVEDRVLALTPEGHVWGWGRNAGGTLGGGLDGRTSPKQLWQGTAIVSGGKYTTCILVNESVQCFGDKLESSSPQLPNDASISELCVGATFVLGVSNGAVFGRRADTDAPSPGGDASLGTRGLEAFGFRADRVHCGDSYALARLADGGVLGWGNNGYYTLTQDRPLSSSVPAGISPSLAGYNALAAGADHACGIPETKDGVYCWGSNEFGASGDLAASNVASPTRVPLPKKPLAVFAGGTQSCAELEDLSTWCWGRNGAGIQPPTKLTWPPP